MQLNRPIVCTIAGHDPSSGAGLNADIKTFENIKVYGVSVCTANTVQSDNIFESANFISQSLIIKQLDILLKRFSIKYFKIGLIPSLASLEEIVSFIRKKVANAFIIWDPILKATSGFEFHTKPEINYSIFDSNFLITPNKDEFKYFDSNKLSHTNYLLKGGHESGIESNDILVLKNKKSIISGLRIQNYEKHGTGCMLSAAILSYLANEETIIDSCIKAKEYVTNRLISNHSLLAYHS